mmetsp:Transcript_8550/g.22018  ORF Transcript_8550/g.22018 Transcript_8550/m.22018 type:complete len:235 (+) Transcript_8550:217-921(+)
MLRIRTPPDEAGWRVFDGVTVLLEHYGEDTPTGDIIVSKSVPYKYFAAGHPDIPGSPAFVSGHPAFYRLKQPAPGHWNYPAVIWRGEFDDPMGWAPHADRDKCWFIRTPDGEGGDYALFLDDDDRGHVPPLEVAGREGLHARNSFEWYCMSHDCTYSDPTVTIAPEFEVALSRIPPRWSIKAHKDFRRPSRAWVAHILLCAHRLSHAPHRLPVMPFDMWAAVLSVLREDDMVPL